MPNASRMMLSSTAMTRRYKQVENFTNRWLDIMNTVSELPSKPNTMRIGGTHRSMTMLMWDKVSFVTSYGVDRVTLPSAKLVVAAILNTFLWISGLSDNFHSTIIDVSKFMTPKKPSTSQGFHFRIFHFDLKSRKMHWYCDMRLFDDRRLLDFSRKNQTASLFIDSLARSLVRLMSSRALHL